MGHDQEMTKIDDSSPGNRRSTTGFSSKHLLLTWFDPIFDEMNQNGSILATFAAIWLRFGWISRARHHLDGICYPDPDLKWAMALHRPDLASVLYFNWILPDLSRFKDPKWPKSMIYLNPGPNLVPEVKIMVWDPISPCQTGQTTQIQGQILKIDPVR